MKKETKENAIIKRTNSKEVRNFTATGFLTKNGECFLLMSSSMI